MIKKLFSFFCDKSLLIFLIIGGLNTIISMLGSQFLLKPLSQITTMDSAYWISTATMFTLCSITSFIFNRKYSFESKAPLVQSIIRFAIVIAVCYLISFGISDYLAPLIIKSIFPDISKEYIVRFAMLLAQVIFTFFNYLGQRLWAFKN